MKTDSKFHIIITGDHGQARSLAVRKQTVRHFCLLALASITLLSIGTYAGITFYQKNSQLTAQTRSLGEELAQTTATLDVVRSERDQLEQDRATLLETSISRLDEKSQVIQEIIELIGVEVKVEEDSGHSGGPFLTSPDEEYGEQLIHETDRFLEVFRQIPVGRPVPGKISSKYGSRKDPLVKKSAFHPGIDFRGKTGDDIKATADGVVKTATRNKVLGRYVVITHANGYETVFAHMHKIMVKKGDTVTRGQVIGLIGNTGRSTGSHLHYGIRHNGKSVDPMKYLQVADLSLTLNR